MTPSIDTWAPTMIFRICPLGLCSFVFRLAGRTSIFKRGRAKQLWHTDELHDGRSGQGQVTVFGMKANRTNRYVNREQHHKKESKS